jgi:hypothetical protein
MLFFIDESWQLASNGVDRIGVLSVTPIKSQDFNECSKHIHSLKLNRLGYERASKEIKGKEFLSNYHFDELESKGIASNMLNLIRDVLDHMRVLGVCFFASIVSSPKEIDLACANVNQLERPFYFLFERIDLFMKEKYPDRKATLIFDDRGLKTNEKISKSVSNFLHKSRTGQSFDNIIKAPFFAISSENIGIQIADVAAYILGAEYTGNKKKIEFYKKIKELEFHSTTLFDINGKMQPRLGFKVIK